MTNKLMSQEQKLLTLLSMRFKILISQGMIIVEDWLKKNLQSSHKDLLIMVKKEGCTSPLIARYFQDGQYQ